MVDAAAKNGSELPALNDCADNATASTRLAAMNASAYRPSQATIPLIATAT